MPYTITESTNFIVNLTLIADYLKEVFGFILRPEQLKAIRTLAVDRRDLILIAKTGFGKSLVFNLIPFI